MSDEADKTQAETPEAKRSEPIDAADRAAAALERIAAAFERMAEAQESTAGIIRDLHNMEVFENIPVRLAEMIERGIGAAVVK